MKTAQKLMVLVFLLFSTGSFASAIEQTASIKVVSTRFDNLFVFKVARGFRGATVEVYYVNGDLVASKAMAMSKRKMIINFCDVKPGTYTIKVKKDGKVEEFTYNRK